VQFQLFPCITKRFRDNDVVGWYNSIDRFDLTRMETIEVNNTTLPVIIILLHISFVASLYFLMISTLYKCTHRCIHLWCTLLWKFWLKASTRTRRPQPMTEPLTNCLKCFTPLTFVVPFVVHQRINWSSGMILPIGKLI
jgi:hypothetical protein